MHFRSLKLRDAMLKVLLYVRSAFSTQEVEMVQGRIVIDTERCKGCELCTTVCPQDVIRMSSSFNTTGYRPVQLVDPLGACTGCAVCAIICPDTAITVYRQVTLRATELRAAV
jgi:2-oxoglutarate ferredoxin oxidoreductase subunit delta